MCFDTRRFWGVIGSKFSESSSHVTAFDNAVQAMYRNKVTPDAGGQYWGAPQVINLHEKCTGTPMINVYPYRMNFKIEGTRQYNTLVHCRVQLARKESRRATSVTLSNAAASARRRERRRTTMAIWTTTMKGIMSLTEASNFSLVSYFILSNIFFTTCNTLAVTSSV
jgi:hypothetical protein